MDRDKALELFYRSNHIDPAAVGNPENGSYDPRIAGLPEQVDRWLKELDPRYHGLLLNLLSRYHYLTGPVCQLRYVRMVALLKAHIQGWCTLDQVLFVTVEPKDGSASGGDNVSCDLRSRHILEMSKKQVIRTRSRLSEARLKEFRAVLFVDDVVGSGISLWGSIQDFCGRFPSVLRAGEGPRLLYSGIVLRREGVKHVLKNCNDKGIPITPLIEKEWFERSAFGKKSPDFRTLQALEELVGNYLLSDPKKSFFMGFCKNRMLVSLHYNTPNNTLSCFWRITPNNAPPFPRDGDQPPKRPALKELRETGERMLSGAYAFGMDRQEKQKHG